MFNNTHNPQYTIISFFFFFFLFILPLHFMASVFFAGFFLSLWELCANSRAKISLEVGPEQNDFSGTKDW